MKLSLHLPINILADFLTPCALYVVANFATPVLGRPAMPLPPECDSVCKVGLSEGYAADVASWVHPDISLDPFYATPENFSSYKIGDMVKWETLGPQAISQLWTIPPGISLSRIFYVSQDLDGSPLPVTGFVLTPYDNPKGQGKPFDVVAWTHGTAGLVRQCAPSNNKNLLYHWEGPYQLALQGYVVVATDYTGQGSDISQGFMYEAGILHAHDTSFSITAVRQALGDSITHEWVAFGQSEGGLTAWRTAQREADEDEAVGGFIGAVAVAPAIEIMAIVPSMVERDRAGIPYVGVPWLFTLQTIAAVIPSFDLTKYVKPKAQSLVPLAQKGCNAIGIQLFQNMSIDDIYYNGANFPSAPEVLEWEKKYHGKGPAEFGAPVLIIQGETDGLIPPENTERILKEQCDEFPNSQAEYVLYPGLDHDGALQASQSLFFSWIADRFSNKTAKTGCSKSRINPTTDKFTTDHQVWQSGGQILWA